MELLTFDERHLESVIRFLHSFPSCINSGNRQVYAILTAIYAGTVVVILAVEAAASALHLNTLIGVILASGLC